MRPIRTFGFRPACVVSALALAACSAWQPLALDLGATRPAKLPYALRVTHLDGSLTTLLAPFIRGDSLHGRIVRDTLSIALNEIRRLDHDAFSIPRTAGLVISVPTAFAIAYLIHCGDNRCGLQLPE